MSLSVTLTFTELLKGPPTSESMLPPTQTGMTDWSLTRSEQRDVLPSTNPLILRWPAEKQAKRLMERGGTRGGKEDQNRRQVEGLA